MATVRLAFEVDTATGKTRVLDLAKSTEQLGKKGREAQQQLQGVSKRAADFSNNVSRVSSTLARSAGAFGLSASALRTLDDVTEVAALGFGNLNKSAAGFNAASVGAAGAGLALGFTIGTLAREHIPGLADAADRAAESLFNLFTGVDGAQLEAEVKASNARILAIQEAQFEAAKAGKGIENMTAARVRQKEETDKLARASDVLGREVKDLDTAERVLAEAHRLSAAGKREEEQRTKELAKAAEQAARELEALDRALEEKLLADGLKEVKALTDEWHQSLQEANREFEAIDWDNFDLDEFGTSAEEAAEAVREMEDALADAARAWDEANEAAHEAQLQAMLDTSDLLDALAELAGGADTSFGRIIQGVSDANRLIVEFQRATTDAGKALAVLGAAQTAFGTKSVFGGALSGATFGSQFGPLGAAIGAGVGGILGGLGGLFGNKEHEQVNDMRDALFEAAGGFEAYAAQLTEIGRSDIWERIWNATKVEEFERAVEDANAALDEHQQRLDKQAEAQRLLQEAIDRYGFTAEELPQKLKQEHFDEVFAGLLRDYELLKEAQFDVNTIIERMGPAWNDAIQQAIAANVPLHESMRPIVEQLIAQGQILDENGKAFTSVEDSGITFTESLTEGLGRAIDAIHELVAALRGIDPPTVRVPVEYDIPPFPGDGRHPGPEERHFGVGGVVTRATRALIGEAGPEAVVPLSNPARAAAVMREAGLGGGIVLQPGAVQINGSGLSASQLEEAVVRSMVRAIRLNQSGVKSEIRMAVNGGAS